MCDSANMHVNALITAQNHGTILVMVAWNLACLLALCIAARLISRFRSQQLRHLPLSGDAVVVAASLCGLGATIVITTAVDSGLGKSQCLMSSTDIDQIQIKIFISTILFVLALSISKSSILLFIHQVADDTLQRVGVMTIGVVVLMWTLAVMTGIIFECEMPKPWEIWTGKCIPMVPFWITITVIDIVIDITLIILSVHMVWTLRLEYRQKALATLIFSLRLLLVAASCIRLVYLKQALSPDNDPTFNYIPYGIATQCQSTISILLACSLILKPVVNLPYAQSNSKPRRHLKHWSGSTIGSKAIGGTPYESFESFGSTPHIIVQEPLHSIQRSMSTPTSPAASDIILPEILPSRARSVKAPPRPPPPSDEERPDLSMFTKTTVCPKKPPVVTMLGSGWEKVGKGRSLKDRGLA